MNQGTIYAIYNKETGKYYIGRTTTQLNKVWKEHLTNYKNKENKSLLYDSMRIYGEELFSIRVIEECSETILELRQEHWISQYDSLNNGYNEIVKEEKKKKIPPKPKVIPPTLPEKEEPKKVKNKGFTIRGNGKHHSIKVKAINVYTLEETYHDSIINCANWLEVKSTHLYRALKNGWKVRGHRIIKLEDKTTSHAIYGMDRVTNKLRYRFPSVRAAARELGSGDNVSGCNKSLKHPHRFTWKGCYWFYQ
jgi:group I intron endonuclease